LTLPTTYCGSSRPQGLAAERFPVLRNWLSLTALLLPGFAEACGNRRQIFKGMQLQSGDVQ